MEATFPEAKGDFSDLSLLKSTDLIGSFEGWPYKNEAEKNLMIHASTGGARQLTLHIGGNPDAKKTAEFGRTALSGARSSLECVVR